MPSLSPFVTASAGPVLSRRACLGVAGAIAGGVGCAAQAARVLRIRFSHVVSEDTPKGLMALRLRERLYQRSGGRMQVEVYPDARLYGDRDEIEALQLGAVEMLAPSLSKFGRIGFPEFELFDLPFLFETAADVDRLTQGPVGRALLQRLGRQQMVGLGYLDNGFKHMSANRPLREPADYAGLRMRVQSSGTIASQMRALRVRPVVLPFSETRRALASGVVDGTENPLSNFWTQRMHEVQSDLSLTRHAYLGYALVVNEAFWKGLSGQQREWLQLSVQEALAYGNGIAAGHHLAALSALRANGRTRIHVPDPAQRARLALAVRPARDDLARRIGSVWLDAAEAAVAKASG